MTASELRAVDANFMKEITNRNGNPIALNDVGYLGFDTKHQINLLE